jgi:mannosyltransferase OCH1-like enzyme
MCFGAQKDEPSENSFEVLMGPCTTTYSSQDLQDIRSFSDEYKKNIRYLHRPTLATIPKVIHFIWLGPKSFPDASVRNVMSWSKHHPDWRLILWTDSRERRPPIHGMEIRLIQEYDFGPLQRLIEGSNNWGEKSDMIRYMLLYKEGGVYADHDVWCDKSVAPLANGFDFVVGCDSQQKHPGIESNVITNTSTIMARPQHPIFEKTIEGVVQGWDIAMQQFPENDPESVFARALQRTLSPFVSAVKKFRNRHGTRDIVLPAIYMYSYQIFPNDIFEKLHSEGYVFVVHKHAGK